ncbi:MAG: hypothetical protein KDC43_20515 [Saprospiraceae bacterium]|nr:hypothetical protein [Saprospiraceae bacterium]MCB0626228.1 hypothetical protein [Saprospiraceae bacterium]MCB0679186.1 hypothetical protein [Saprospiraceae bacterium]MCB0683382.1 hypothetical protein [Saprospiraceae bacterium]
MPYQSRKRNYRSRRERTQRSTRNFKVVMVFALLGSAVWIFKIRYDLWSYIKTYFY